MTWLAHQRQGFFGWTVQRPSPQPRHLATVDVAEACERASDVLEAFWATLRWPNAPPFSGGVLDAWPARMADGLAVARDEWAAVQAYAQHEAQAREVKRG